MLYHHTHIHTHIYIYYITNMWIDPDTHQTFCPLQRYMIVLVSVHQELERRPWRRFWTNQCLTLEHFENWLTVSSEDFLKDLNHVSLVVWSTFFMSDLRVCSQLQGPKLDDKWVSTFRRLGWVRELSYLHRKEMMQPMIWCLVRT